MCRVLALTFFPHVGSGDLFITVSDFTSFSLPMCAELLFFFFQAEDGIRDVAVTGVQTCALPISAGQEFEDGEEERYAEREGDQFETQPPQPVDREAAAHAARVTRFPGGHEPAQQIGRASCRERV